MRAPFAATRPSVTRSPLAIEGRRTVSAGVVTVACLALVASIIPAAALAAVAPPSPPTITPLCATDREYLWTVSSDATGLADYDIDYTTKRTDDWSYPNGITGAALAATPSGGHAMTLFTAKVDGTSLNVRWTSFPGQVAGSSTAPPNACTLASLTVRRVVQGGTAMPRQFPASMTRSTLAFVDPSLSETIATPVTSDAAQSMQAGDYAIGPTKEAGAYVALPPGYVFRSTVCATTTNGGATSTASATTDPLSQRLLVAALPGSSTICTITYHDGPVLDDTIAAGRKTAGTTGFTASTITVKKGTYVTYLVTTSPSLAGRKVQIWTKAGSVSKPWKLTKTVTVAGGGSIRFYAKVTAFTGFLARWAGDGTYVASSANGRYVNVD